MSPRLAQGLLLGLAMGVGLLLVLVALTGPERTGRPGRTGRLARLIGEAGLTGVTVGGLVGTCALTGLLAGILTLVVTAVPTAALIGCGIAAYAPIVVLRRRANARRRELRDSWPEAVDSLVSGVRAGMSLPEAVGELGTRGPTPLREPFADFAGHYRATGSFASALTVLQARLSDPVADRVVASLRIARDVGGSDLGIVLRTLSALLREDARTRGEIEARQSWTVTAARMAVAAPWVTLALLCTRPEAAAAYGTASGAMVLVVAAVLSLAAYRMMLRIGRLPSEPRIAS